MINGELKEIKKGWYQIGLENGQSFKLEEKYLPASCLARGGKINLIFGSDDQAAAGPEESRALLNHLLGSSA